MTTSVNEERIIHQYNSDSTTCDLFKQMEPEFHRYCTMGEWRHNHQLPSFEISREYIQTKIYPKLQQQSEKLAQQLAISTIRRVKTEERWACQQNRLTLSRCFVELFFSRQIRRGPIPVEEDQIKLREKVITNGIKSGLQFSILMLPNRDENLAKNDGHLPDLGEILSLVKLWSIVRAMFLIKDYFIQQILVKLFRKIFEKSKIETIYDIERLLGEMLTLRTSPIISVDDEFDIINYLIIKLLSNRKYSKYTTNLRQMYDELMPYEIKKIEKVELLIIELVKHQITLKWLFETVQQLLSIEQNSIEIIVVQDAHRYTCYDTDNRQHIYEYTQALNQIVQQMNLQQYIKLISHNQLEKDSEENKIFQIQRQQLYDEQYFKLIKPFIESKSSVLQASISRDKFRAKIEELSLNENIVELIEPVLHGRLHPELIDAHLSPIQELKFLAQIYEVSQDNDTEKLRQEVLFSSLINAIKYICSYETQTSTKNYLNLDDIEFLLPKSIRLSIHNKPFHQTRVQFLIKTSSNLHRQPWHGTVTLRRSQKKHFVFDIQLSLLYKLNKYIPVFVTSSLSTTDDYFSKLAKNIQPIMWVHPDLIKDYDQQFNGEMLLSKLLFDDDHVNNLRI
ncbi:unnamed protein product [Didymodactylos carnosus]|uniref:Uncharacterized protein n=1 Tax=Didymodactylos carnosus TaxID=1234261 RepID=A0A815FRT8_9BILA|nr:unnamed protein product [Didymodactylos carnosus]CAF4182313.1 unnamed protein product [Didymodactylos carnosus]